MPPTSNDPSQQLSTPPTEPSAPPPEPFGAPMTGGQPAPSSYAAPQTPLPTDALTDTSLHATPPAAGAVFNPMGASAAPTPVAPAPFSPPPAQSPAFVAASPAPSVPPLKKKSRAKLFLVIAAVLIVLLGGSAAAYVGYYLPSKPDNKLGLALLNLAQQKQISVKGTFDVESNSKTASFPGVAVNFNLGADLTKTELSTSGTLGISGTQFPFDVRYIDKNIYLKVGGLEALGKVIPSASAATVNPYLKAVGSINNQWYVIDRSFVDSLGSSTTCATNLSFTLTDADAKKIKSAYEKDPLFKVKSTSPATIDGVVTSKMILDPASDQTASAFASQLNSLSIVQNVRKCLHESTMAGQLDHAITLPKNNSSVSAGETLAAYVTADKRIKKLELNSSSKDTSDDLSLTFQDQPPSIVAPTGAKPIQDILSAFVGSDGTSALSGLAN